MAQADQTLNLQQLHQQVVVVVDYLVVRQGLQEALDYLVALVVVEEGA